MEFKDFAESAEIEYRTEVIVNGVHAGSISNLSEDSHIEEFRKLDHAIKAELDQQWYDLPENIEV